MHFMEKEAVKEKEKRRSHEVWKTESRLSDPNTALSITALNRNRLSNPSKGRNLQTQFLKSEVSPYAVYERHTLTNRSDAKGSGKLYQVNSNHGKAGVAVLMPDSAFKTTKQLLLEIKASSLQR